MMRIRRWLWLLLLCAPLAVAAPPVSSPPLQGLDAYVQRVMRDWQVPGLAVAVVSNGEVVIARGYGVRELGKPGRVDANTLFDIGSNTKAFTVAALGTLVSSGKLAWDTPVIDELHDFRLRSPWVTRHITLLDLLTHRTGYCDPTMAWYTSNASNIIWRVRYQKPRYGFRAAFCYNNVQYLAASRFIPAITGESWNSYVAAHLLAPLDMTRTVTTNAAVSASSDVAVPHGMVSGNPAVIRRYWPHNMDIFAAVGGIWSSANDMSHWLQMLLADGRYKSKTVLQPAVVRAMETPQMLIQPSGEVGREIRVWTPGGHFYTYGLGLFVQDYHGHTLVWHAGDIDGMASAVALVPSAQLGIVVLSNMNEAGARFAIIAHTLQTELGLPRHDLESALLAQAHKASTKVAAAQKKLAATRVPNAKPPLPLPDYAGTYRDDLDGTARVQLDDGHLVLRLGNPDFTGDLQPWHGNTFRVTWRYHFYGVDYATFDVSALREPIRVTLALSDLHFERVNSPVGRSKEDHK